ncbi:type IV pilus biogenesis/stability protein PilW [Motilimonas pumila]|uniref:Type IV pilus biogenesis/stability protein PilW n=1 Tax=Motilimonas pumila TaxID=2303987 RepID=A0A418YB97_9GAMM|nr:type IV pilus biogenesis/stability protein PilW [Motilimonas pumila]RJG40241.1 type IV pilus biogenesis/stability protein PilW [Motilimonas pumila]
MKKFLLVASAVLSLSACVSETTIDGKRVEASPNLESAAKTRMSLGIEYLKQGNTQQAKFNLEKALEYDPRNPEIHRTLAYYYEVVNEPLQAEDAYKKALSYDRSNADTMNNYGTFLCRQEKFEEAEKQFKNAVKQKSYIRVDDTYENAGLCARKAGELEKAKEYFNSALSHNPQKPLSLVEMAAIAVEQQDYDGARAYLLKYQQLSSDTAHSLWTWISLESAQNRETAVKSFGRRLVKKFPNSKESQKYLNNEY